MCDSKGAKEFTTEVADSTEVQSRGRRFSRFMIARKYMDVESLFIGIPFERGRALRGV